MEIKINYPHTPIQLELPGLSQRFKMRWAKGDLEEKWRVVDGRNEAWFSPSYEAVFESENTWNGENIGTRAMTKLIFNSCADENERPLGVEEMLHAVPEDMLQYLVDLLNNRWAVVTFENIGNDTRYIINLENSDLYAQKQANIDAIYGAIDNELKTPGPYMIVENGTIRLVPGSEQDDYPVPHKGIFWLIKNADDDDEVLSVKVPCDPNGYPLRSVDFSSASGQNFNHRAEWEKLPRKLTRGKPFDYYPRGRVEIKDRKVTVYCHPSLTQSPYRLMITGEFGVPSATTRFVADGSIHYQARRDTE